MKKLNKKGFTLVELVIVIAVIAILAAVLIPVFSNVISNAKDSAALQNARNTFEAYAADHAKTIDSIYIVIKADDSHFYAVKAGQLVSDTNGIVKYSTADDAKTAAVTGATGTPAWEDANDTIDGVTYQCQIYVCSFS